MIYNFFILFINLIEFFLLKYINCQYYKNKLAFNFLIICQIHIKLDFNFID